MLLPPRKVEYTKPVASRVEHGYEGIRQPTITGPIGAAVRLKGTRSGREARIFRSAGYVCIARVDCHRSRKVAAASTEIRGVQERTTCEAQLRYETVEHAGDISLIFGL